MNNQQGLFLDNLRRQISSPAALFVFEATARCGSFNVAAAELNVTQPSVSYQIKQLEKHLGIKLFERRGRTVVLTEDGVTLYRAIEQGFTAIQTGLNNIKHKANTNLITFCCATAAATNFFLPRLHRLKASYPYMEISVKIISRDVNPTAENAEFSLRLGDGSWDDLDAWHLFDEVYFPVCSPEFAKRSNPPISSSNLSSHQLLFLKEKYRNRDDWHVFFERVGMPMAESEPRMIFSDQQALLTSAIEGQGIGIGWLGMNDNLLDTGALVRPTELEVRTERAFYLISPRGMKHTKMSTAFKEWMVDEGRAIKSRWESSGPVFVRKT